MTVCQDTPLVSQAEYIKKLRPFLPASAFEPNPSKLIILFINLGILILGWAIAEKLDHWPVNLLWLYLPLAVVMGNSVMVVSFSSHDLLHGTVIRNSRMIRVISLLGQTMLWMPPTLWKAVHNRVHHKKTNSLGDPDRNYLYDQPKTWGNWGQNLIVPSAEVNPVWLTVGMATAWILYTFRHLTSVLLFNSESVDYVAAPVVVSAKERVRIAGEFLLILMVHLSILAYLQFNPLKLLLSYFIPLGIGYAGLIFYIYTHHMVCRMTSTNDPLVNTISLRVPKLIDLLHLNFSYHTEHHLFPGIDSDYYPLIQELLKIHYPDKSSNYILDVGEAWRLLLQTPRHYKDETTFTDWSGQKSVTCPLSQESQRLIN
ncbi:MAG TPA: fatty acid desaturase [Candidatus Obscuribacterales bacterium]